MALKVETKRDQRLVQKGRSEARAAARAKAGAGRTVKTALTAAGAVAGQKYLASMPTPMWPSIPMSYSVPVGLFALEMVGVKLVSGKSKTYLDALMDGVVAGELGARARTGQKLF